MDLDFLAPLIELDLDFELVVYVTSMTGFFEEIDQPETLSRLSPGHLESYQ